MPLNQHPVKAEQRDREGRPSEPRPEVQPARRNLAGLDRESGAGRPVRPIEGDLNVPPTRLGKLEDGLLEEPVARRPGRCRVLQYLSGPPRRQAQRHPCLRRTFAGRRVLHEQSEGHGPGPERGGKGEHGEPVVAGPLAQANRALVRPCQG